jgi:hypothetical protein
MYNDRSKQQEREVHVGTRSVHYLHAVVPLHPTLLPVQTIRSPHQFILPQNTIDQARTRSQQIQPHIPQIPQFRFMVPP